MYSEEQKEKTRERLAKYVQRYPSLNMAAASLKDISPASVSNILQKKWNVIGEKMWLRLEAQLARNDGWQIYATRAYKDMTLYLRVAQEESRVMWIAAPAGIGKSTAAGSYAALNRNVFRLTCSSDMTKTDFVQELAALVGVRTSGLTVRASFSAILRHLATLQQPLLVFDEADKLPDSVMYYFISIYNALEDRAGIVFLSTNYIRQRIRRGVDKGKKGYDELESRICRSYVDLTPVSASEVEQICLANGLQAREGIARVKTEGGRYGNDLRRVKSVVRTELRKMDLFSGQEEAE